MIRIPDPYMAAAKILGAVLALALVCAVVWWAVIKPRSDLADERAAHAETKAAHAAVMADLAQKTAAVAARAAAAKDAYTQVQVQAAEDYKRGVDDAYKRGMATASGIRDGTVRVRDVWRNADCPGTAAGEGAERDGGAAGVHTDRAAAIGEVLGIAGEGDATYQLCYTRLKATQKLLDACYEEPATP